MLLQQVLLNNRMQNNEIRQLSHHAQKLTPNKLNI